MTTHEDWFGASKAGLEKIARRRGLAYVVLELVQNALDTGAKTITVHLSPVEGRPLVNLVVEDDDPDGFRDLSHAWTLFAESEKKVDPTKRGRFNFGEKLVLAVCETAEIASTKGTVHFGDKGRLLSRKRTDKGTTFFGRVKMTRAELEEVRAAAASIIVPHGVQLIVDGRRVFPRNPINEFEAKLMTEVADSEGFLTQALRHATVRVYETPRGQTEGRLYEMGLPICTTGDKWDVEIMQKVPVSLDRMAVSDAYHQAVRVALLNAMHDYLSPSDVASPAVQAAVEDKRASRAAVVGVLAKQYGEKRAIFDPSDLEANNRLASEGYAIIPSRAFSKAAWENIRTSEAALPSGRIRPTPKPYSSDPGAAERELLPEDQWTNGMREIARYAEAVAVRLLGKTIRVSIDKGKPGQRWEACYGGGELTFNLAVLGGNFFCQGPSQHVNEVIIHELSHDSCANHLDERFYMALERNGAKLVALALAEPEFFRAHGWSPRMAEPSEFVARGSQCAGRAARDGTS
jgi:hypothetical protein